MTPKVRDILIAARREIHAATATHANICDTQALFTLDQLITADADRALNFTTAQTDIIADVTGRDDDTDRPTEKLPAVRPSLTEPERAELERLRKEKVQDTAIIDGLRAKLEGKAQN